MQLNTGQWVIMILAGILILGVILGYYYNRKHAEVIFRWLRQGLSTLGEVTIGDKLPGMATGGRLEVNQANPPLKRAEAVYLLAPRENLIFWIIYKLQGRGDELIIWMTYASKPDQSVEVARKGDRQFAKRLQSTEKARLKQLEAPPNLLFAAEEMHGAHEANKVTNFIQAHASEIVRLALRPEKPHLFLRMKLGKTIDAPAEQFFAQLMELAG